MPFTENGGIHTLPGLGMQIMAYAARILTAAMVSNGAYHLLLGETSGVMRRSHFLNQ
ncbi:MAG: hypothetical protein K2P07_15025 [Lachnospiraceae bacterium]|nr:hypothetical protein [Lachnospiraceae bacterium]